MKSIQIINNAEPSETKFADDIARVLTNSLYKITICQYLDIKKNLHSADGIILSGSPQGDDIVGHHLPYFQWIKDFPNLF